VFCVPTILEAWKTEETTWHKNLTSLRFKFFIHFLTNVLFKLNKVNYKFQSYLIDITDIASKVDVAINLLRRHTWVQILT